MARHVVTGGAGFIGSHIAQRLLGLGHKVVVIDNFHTGKMENLSFAKGNPDFEFIEAGCERLPDIGGKVDGVFHFGIYSSTPMYRERPELIGTACAGFVNIFELAKKQGCKIVQASTSSLYNGQEPPHREGMEIFPLDFYTEARLFAERLASVYGSQYGVKSASLRLFSVYGPREEAKGRYANLVSQFIWSMQKGEPALVFGDGSQRRDFTFITDVVDACVLAMEQEGLVGPTNVGTGKSTSLAELVGMIGEGMGRKIPPRFEKNTIKNYVAETQADLGKISAFGYMPKIDLRSGIGKCIEYYGEKR